MEEVKVFFNTEALKWHTSGARAVPQRTPPRATRVPPPGGLQDRIVGPEVAPKAPKWPSHSLQKQIHLCINSHVSDESLWVPFINYKLAVLGATSTDGLPVSLELWKGLCQVIRKEPPQVATCFLKTVINSWYTTHRMGEVPRLACIFGCPGCEDNLKHYLACEPMWTLAASAGGLTWDFLSLSPSERLCIFKRSRTGLKLLSVVFRGYHALKLDQRCLIDRCIARDDYEDIFLLFVKLCRELWCFH